MTLNITDLAERIAKETIYQIVVALTKILNGEYDD